MASRDPTLLRRLLRATNRIDAASEEGWPVERLADVSGVSEAHFARSFKEAFGVPPHCYLLTRRIERAKALLRDTDEAIIEIALQTGWNSLGTFGCSATSPARARASCAREQTSAHQLDQVPHCFVSAAYRPEKPAERSLIGDPSTIQRNARAWPRTTAFASPCISGRPPSCRLAVLPL
jgi:AraC-like DNA-binding protein